MDALKSHFAVSIVIPVYNSALTLPAVLDEIESELPKLGLRYEVILVNDGSPDGTWQTIPALLKRHAHVVGINLMRNYGQHSALLCGIRNARNPVVITMDDDGQHPVSAIPRMLERILAGSDVVYGAPTREVYSFFRSLPSWATKFVLQRALGVRMAGKLSSFRAFRTELRDAFQAVQGPFVDLDVLLSWGARKIEFTPVEFRPRAQGRSNYSLRKLLRHTLNMLTGNSVVPLQLVSLVGFSLTLFGLAILGYVLFVYLFMEGVVPGFTFLASMIAIFSGAQLFALGIFGEYLARMHFRLMGQPSYVIREKLQNAEEKA